MSNPKRKPAAKPSKLDLHFCTGGGCLNCSADNPCRPAPLLPGVSASECRELMDTVLCYALEFEAGNRRGAGNDLRRAAAILRSVADAIEKGEGEP